MPDQSVSRPIDRLLLLGLIIPCLLISIPAIVAYHAQRQLSASFHWVAHTIEVQHQIQHLVSVMLDAESNERAFLLTSNESYLEPYQRAVEEIPRQIDALRTLASDNPVQQENLRQLDPLTATKLDFMARSISLHQQGKHDAEVALINTLKGKEAMDAIRARLDLMEQEESRLLVKREEHLGSRARFSTIFLFLLVALNLVFAAVTFVFGRRLSKLRNLVTICAWSRTVEYEGHWLSFEEYLHRRFNLDSSHGISPAEAEKAFGKLEHK